MVTRPSTRNPFERLPSGYNYGPRWDANVVWAAVALALVVFALAIWAFMASGWYQPAIEAPVDVPGVQSSSPNERAELPPETVTP